MVELFEKFRGQLPNVTERELDLYLAHHEFLKRSNAGVNLVSFSTLSRAFSVHYVDSLFICEVASKVWREDEIFDFGSGAGFPGLIFSIRFLKSKVTLFEKENRKRSFLEDFISKKGLSNVRVEGAVPDKLATGLILARAFLPKEKLFKFITHRASPLTLLVLCSGARASPTDASSRFECVKRVKYELPLGEGGRRVEIFEFVPRGTK